MSERLILAPQGECVSLTEAKLHLRVTDTSQDLLIAGFVAGARQAAEMKTRNQLLHARWMLTLDRFPGWSGYGCAFSEVENLVGFGIQLPHSPLCEVESVQYIDTSGVMQTDDLNNYAINYSIQPGLITPKFGNIWPINQPQIASVMITYTAGYASPFAVTEQELKVNGPVAWEVGDIVQLYNSGGALPTGLLPATNYQVATASSTPNSGVYTLQNLDGSPVELTDAGSGSSFIGVVPEGIRNWIKLRTGSLYQNREEVAVLNRGTLADLPFVEGLLDPYKVVLP